MEEAGGAVRNALRTALGRTEAATLGGELGLPMPPGGLGGLLS